MSQKTEALAKIYSAESRTAALDATKAFADTFAPFEKATAKITEDLEVHQGQFPLFVVGALTLSSMPQDRNDLGMPSRKSSHASHGPGMAKGSILYSPVPSRPSPISIILATRTEMPSWREINPHASYGTIVSEPPKLAENGGMM